MWQTARKIIPTLGFLMLAGCQLQPQAKVESSAARACPEPYDATIDYFPNKVRVQHAVGFEVEYHDHYKVVTVRNPWRGSTETFRYVLVQCGAPLPEEAAGAQVIEVPVQSAIALSTTHLPHFTKLGLLDRLIGVSRFRQVSTPEVREKIASGALVETGTGSTLNVEVLLTARPDLVLAFGTGNAESDSHPKLLELGIPVAIVSEYMEASPLGRAEWLKFTALFFNAEQAATVEFASIARQYEAARQLAWDVEQRPTVLVGHSFNGTWSVPGGRSFVAQFLEDAGADYLWAERDTTGSVPLGFEAVYERARDADFWLNGSQTWRTRADAIAQDERYGRFSALQNGQLFNNDARLNPSGGNDYWESGMVNPHEILADLVAIFHPERLPERELVYYRRLN